MDTTNEITKHKPELSSHLHKNSPDEEKKLSFEVTYFAFDRVVERVVVGVFPSKGRYFRQVMETKDGVFYYAHILVPKGKSFYQLIINDNSENPVGDVPGVMSLMDPFKRIAINLETNIFCPIIFQDVTNHIENIGEVLVEVRAISMHGSIHQVSIIDENMQSFPMSISFQLQHKKYWSARLNTGANHGKFLLKIEGAGFVKYFHKGNVFKDRPDFQASFKIKSKPQLSRSIRPDQVGYQIFPDRFLKTTIEEEQDQYTSWDSEPGHYSYFGGDLNGIRQKLDYLKGLGIGFIYLNPIFHAINSHRYDVVDFKSIDPRLGNEDDFRKLISEAQELQIKIILDIPLNHCSVNFFAFRDVLEKQSDSEYVSWYEIHDFPVVVKDNPLYSCWSGYKEYPQFDFNEKNVRQYFFEVVSLWVGEFNIDGWRLDSSSEIPYDFIQELAQHSRAINPSLYIVGENWHNDFEILHYGIDGITNYELYWNVISPFFEKKRKLKQLASDIMEHFYKYPLAYLKYSWNFLSNHDLPRFYSILNDKTTYKLTLSLMFCLPGIPMIYYGEEINMTGLQDPANRRGMEWGNVSKNKETIDHIKFLTTLRSDYHQIFSDGDLMISYLNEKDHVMVISRGSNENKLLFIFNFSAEEQQLPLHEFSLNATIWNISDNKDQTNEVFISPKQCLILMQKEYRHKKEISLI